jgi:hypothetical protein
MDIKIKNYYLFSVPTDFEISKIHIPYSRHIIIELFVDGKYGIGEGISYKSSFSQIEQYLAIEQHNLEPGLAAAFDQAVLDAQNEIHNYETHEYTRQVFIEKPEIMLNRVGKLVQRGCRQIKLKLGRDIKNDIYLLNTLHKSFGAVKFRADVNGGYPLVDFERVIDATGNFIKTWEEPVAKKYLPEILKLKNKFKLKIILDENVKTIEDLNFYIKNNVIDILNIKLSRIGGVTAAQKYVAICKKYNILISIGCSEELGIGMQAINYLVSSIPHIFGVEGEGSERLGFDILDQKNNFDLRKLEKAAQKFHFRIFTRKNNMSVFDKLFEYKDNINAKYRNLLIKLCR